MPAFLVISGWLMPTHKPVDAFLRGLTRIIVPYIIMESAYIVASSVLGIEPLLAPLTPLLFLKTLFFAPVGPYWFLHTLFLCALISYFCTQKLVRKPLISMLAQFVLVFLLSKLISFSFYCALYFVFGTYLKQQNISLVQFLSFKKWYLIPLLCITIFSSSYHKESTLGVLLVYLIMSLCTFLYAHQGRFCHKITSYIGQNTLPILLFSPLFTLLAKRLIPFLSFDETRLLFAVCGTLLAVCGSLALHKTLKTLFNVALKQRNES
jgi:acyltransferase